MGLFTNSSHTDVEVGTRLLAKSVQSFNDAPGSAYSIIASLNTEALEVACGVFDRLAENLPESPGPFKRLAGLTILAQCHDLFLFEREVRSGLPALTAEDHIVWAPRIAIWAIGDFAEAIAVNGNPEFLRAFEMPTPHFQVEFIALLRNFAYGAKSVRCPEDALLLERISSTALILEAAAYATQDRQGHYINTGAAAEACLLAVAEDPILREDVRFNDPNFLNMAVGIGLD